MVRNSADTHNQDVIGSIGIGSKAAQVWRSIFVRSVYLMLKTTHWYKKASGFDNKHQLVNSASQAMLLRNYLSATSVVVTFAILSVCEAGNITLPWD